MPASLLVTETTGARNTMLNGILRILARAAKAVGTQDNTRYGLSRESPKGYYDHHSAEISHAIVMSDARYVTAAAAAIGHSLVAGIHA